MEHLISRRVRGAGLVGHRVTTTVPVMNRWIVHR